MAVNIRLAGPPGDVHALAEALARYGQLSKRTYASKTAGDTRRYFWIDEEQIGALLVALAAGNPALPVIAKPADSDP